MSSALRKIDPSGYAADGVRYAPDVGKRPDLRWLKIERLRVDMDYQRDIGRRGANSIRAIARDFNWASFEAATVAAIGGGLYAIINGQHRVTAAALCRISEVPCLVVVADKVQQAKSFAAINTQITAVTPMQLHAARIAAGDGGARDLVKVCEQAGVTICRYPVPVKNMKPGETMAVGKLASALTRYGPDVLRTALQCITTHPRNVGMVRAPVIEALCVVMEAEPAWRRSRNLVDAMRRYDYFKAYTMAGKASFDNGRSITSELVERIGAYLEQSLKGVA